MLSFPEKHFNIRHLQSNNYEKLNGFQFKKKKKKKDTHNQNHFYKSISDTHILLVQVKQILILSTSV